MNRGLKFIDVTDDATRTQVVFFIPACYSVFNMHGCLHSCWSSTVCTVVSSSGRIHVCSECNIQMEHWDAFIVKHVVRVWLSHHVRETGSLCEHDPNVLLCNRENGRRASLFLWRFSSWCCLCGRSCSQGVGEAVKPFTRRLTFSDQIVFTLRVIYVEASRVDEEGRSYWLCWLFERNDSE